MTEWGPWLYHAPGPCPVPIGTWIQVKLLGSEKVHEGVVNADRWRAFSVYHRAWRHHHYLYRTRVEREYSGMDTLRSLLVTEEA